MVTVEFQITNQMAKEIEYMLGRQYGEYDKLINLNNLCRAIVLKGLADEYQKEADEAIRRL